MKIRKTPSLRRPLIAGIALLAASSVSPLSAQLTSISFDFGTDPGKTTFGAAGFTHVVEVTGPTATDVADAVRLSFSGSSRTQSAIERTFSGLALGDNNAFTISTAFTMISNPNQQNNNRTWGIRMFGASGDLDSGITAFIENQGGTGGDDIMIVQGQDGSTFQSVGIDLNGDSTLEEYGTDIGAPATRNYSFTVEGSFNGAGDLNLDFTVSDGTNSQLVTGTVLAGDPALAGDFFGLSGDNAISGGIDTTFDFDSYSVTVVPEPSAFALLAGCLAFGWMTFRRRA
jgi:hypothetical protein